MSHREIDESNELRFVGVLGGRLSKTPKKYLANKSTISWLLSI